METKIQPEIALRRKVCATCGYATFEFASDSRMLQRYVCTRCSV